MKAVNSARLQHPESESEMQIRDTMQMRTSDEKDRGEKLSTRKDCVIDHHCALVVTAERGRAGRHAPVVGTGM